eukprot:CAMPEP_0197590660 /NCGR_PEP_ID=MMETSP1326-20131121/11823_1 /TAXON_ID=1155430 /ORGANISM="Genus nov. species nov., Strain RCC2288" /LENGTH=142 /DNA_ID=CAMNT_0043155837 /DNA_START=47 /DNA_END=475 /DNA_ORIENTATION=+
MSITISNEFGYAAYAVGAGLLACTYGAFVVVSARKKYDVQYPNLYAPESHKKKKEFDCAQRAHQNTLEAFPAVAVSVVINALAYPRASAILGGIWALGRVLYIRGYSSGDPDKRMTGGMVSHLGDLPLMIMLFFTGYKLTNA